MSVLEQLKERFAHSTAVVCKDGHDTVSVPRADFRDAALWMKEHGYGRFIDLTCVDHPEQPERFELHLVLYSMDQHTWARVITYTDEDVDSLVPVFIAAHNYEREVFDLFGVHFLGHPALTRLMLPEGWVGHPLQRDAAMSLEPVDFTVTRELYKT